MTAKPMTASSTVMSSGWRAVARSPTRRTGTSNISIDAIMMPTAAPR
jgi:hypothetical protein